MSADDLKGSSKSQARLASIVIVVTMGAWLLLSFLGGQLGIAAKYAFLVDLAAMAAFAWALIVCFKIWRARQVDKES